MTRSTGDRPAERPEPDVDQMATDTLMTSVFAGIGFVISVIVYSLTGGLGLRFAQGSTAAMAMIAFGIGLMLGVGLIVQLLWRFAPRMQARSRNLYRGAWIGSMGGLVIIIFMYYLPWIAFPSYCPPGSVCQ